MSGEGEGRTECPQPASRVDILVVQRLLPILQLRDTAMWAPIGPQQRQRITDIHAYEACNNPSGVIAGFFSLKQTTSIIYPPTPFPSVFTVQMLHVVYYFPINSFWWGHKKSHAPTI